MLLLCFQHHSLLSLILEDSHRPSRRPASSRSSHQSNGASSCAHPSAHCKVHTVKGAHWTREKWVQEGNPEQYCLPPVNVYPYSKDTQSGQSFLRQCDGNFQYTFLFSVWGPIFRHSSHFFKVRHLKFFFSFHPSHFFLHNFSSFVVRYHDTKVKWT